MNTALLITFGCSWTFGVGVGYQDAMTESEYNQIIWDRNICDKLSFRGILATKFKMDALNFSMGGASNQQQIRLSKEYFSSPLYQEHRVKYKKIIVLWGITSTARNEFYFANTKTRKSFMYSKPNSLSKLMLTDYYDHNHEVSQLTTEIKFWSLFFKQNNIDVIWFDTFNHHQYSIDVTEYNFLHAEHSPRDLLSWLANTTGWEQKVDGYHLSDWIEDSDRITICKNNKLVNPLSLHPTQIGHQYISQMFDTYIEKML